MTAATSSFYIEPLDSTKHDRRVFDCGVDSLNEYLRKNARQEVAAGTSTCFVAIPITEPATIAGYYTLSATTIERSSLSDHILKGLPRYRELPATLLGRLARSLDYRGAQVGARLMSSAMKRAVESAQQVASWALVTDPINDRARRFYTSFGFRPLTSGRLFLTLHEAAALIAL